MGAVFDLNTRWTNPENNHDQIVEMQVFIKIFLRLVMIVNHFRMLNIALFNMMLLSLGLRYLAMRISEDFFLRSQDFWGLTI